MIGFDEDIDGFLAGMDLDTNGGIPKSTSWRHLLLPRMIALGTMTLLKFRLA